MDCVNIQRLLSEYIDGVLDAQTRDKVEKHLSTCERCGEEIESLKALIRDLETLPRVKAPDDFLEQLHERMHARFDFWAYIKGFSRFFQMRIPLQIAAATAMAVLIFAIVYSPHIGDRITDMQVDKVQEVLEEQEKETMTASAPMEIKAEMPSKPQAPAERDEQMGIEIQEVSKAREGAAVKSPEPALEKLEPTLKRTSQPPVPMTAAVKPVLPKSSAEEVQRIELSLLLKRADKGDVRSRSYDMEAKSAPSVPEKTSARSFGAGGEEKLGGVTLKDKQRFDYFKEDNAIQEADTEGSPPRDGSGTWVLSPYEARKQVESFVAKVQGRMLKVETKDKTDVPVYVDVEIPADQYSDFYRELHRIGTVRSSLPAISEKDQNPIQIRVRFVME
ncbi:MAG: zf-HC2 domain-containing protein [Deltaproteobacteria bacterium]|nr:zf-HC2 domain-containing protein [Deltaproteobacteria bacterium]